MTGNTKLAKRPLSRKTKLAKRPLSRKTKLAKRPLPSTSADPSARRPFRAPADDDCGPDQSRAGGARVVPSATSCVAPAIPRQPADGYA